MTLTVLDNAVIRKQIKPISIEQYHKIGELGIISEKTELIKGLILEKMAKSPLHSYFVYQLNLFFVQFLPKNYIVRKKEPLTLFDSEPEPDLSILLGDIGKFRTVHPNWAELVIEVAVSSVELDREKRHIYASAKIPTYWIVLPTQKQIEVYTSPEAGEYQTVRIYELTEQIETICGLQLDLNTLVGV